MQRMRYVAFLGDRSPYGNHHLIPFLNMEAGRLVAVFVPTDRLWRRFAERHNKQSKTSDDGNGRPALFRRIRRKTQQLWMRRRLRRASTPIGRGSVQPAKVDVPAVCSRSGIPVHFVDSANSSETLSLLGEYKPDVILSAAFPQIFSSAFLALPQICAVNFHPSALPAYRGRHPHYWVVRNGETITGVSAHILESTIDTGPVLATVPVLIAANDYYEDLYSRINYTTPRVVAELDTKLHSRSIDGVPQIADNATYFSEPTDANRCLRWSDMSAAEAYNTVRAGGAFCYFRDQRLTVLSAEAPSHQSRQTLARPGELSRVNGRCVVQAADGILPLKLLQFGTIIAPADVLCQAVQIAVGETLTSSPI